CGGESGYEEFLEAIKDPNQEQHEEMLEWVGGEFDPEHFDVNEVMFEDPIEHLRDRDLFM
ncbi:MAG: plasmid pRiA4b ORF-3 family protein, partial [Proteobacteria bacterium]|nr:plasmid pRiA4b ORF-3 family protein [Pseudomonadota bacterium]